MTTSDDDDPFSLDFTSMLSEPEPPVVAPPPEKPKVTLALVDDGLPMPVSDTPAPAASLSTMKLVDDVPVAKYALELSPQETPKDNLSPAAVETAPVRPSRPKRATPLPQILVQAAMLHSLGQEVDAVRGLEGVLKRNAALGDAELLVWAGLFDLLQVLDRRPAYDQVAMAFVKHFERSPPAWVEKSSASATADASKAASGYICFAGTLNANIGDVLKHAMSLAKSITDPHFDLNALTGVDNDGAMLLLKAVAALTKAKKEFAFVNPQHLVKIIKSKLQVGEKRDEQMWLLMLELYQHIGDQDPYEEEAVNYAITFEVSPPAWVPVTPSSKPKASAPQTAATEPEMPPGYRLEGEIKARTADSFAELETAVGDSMEYEIDARNLMRIDEFSAKNLLEVVRRLDSKGKNLRFTGLQALVAVFLESHGFAECCELRTRPI